MAFYRRSFGRRSYGRGRSSYGRRPYYGYRSRARTYGPSRRRFTSTRRVRFGGRRY